MKCKIWVVVFYVPRACLLAIMWLPFVLEVLLFIRKFHWKTVCGTKREKAEWKTLGDKKLYCSNRNTVSYILYDA